MVFIKKKPVLLTPLPSLAMILEPIPPALAASSPAGPSSANGISEPAPLPSDGKNDEEQMDKLISAFKGDFPGVMGTAAVKLKKGKRESLAAGSNGSKANGHDGDSASVAGPSSNGVSNPEPISWKSWDRECFYIPETGEIFTDYESFLSRVTFYQESMFQCEVSSKTSMNFYDAQISEQRETRQLHTRFIRPLKRAILRSIQFQIEGKLDSVVDRIFERFSNRFFDEERVFVDVEGDKYLAKIVKTFPPKTLASKPRQSLAPNGTSAPSPHMHASDFNLTNEEVLKKDDPMKYFYNVRLIEEGAEEGNVAEYRSASGSGAGIEEGEGESWGGSTMEVQADKISRDKVNFSKANLKRFLANCVVRDTSLYSPWLLRHSVAVRYGMPREMPEEVRLRIWQFKEKQMEKRRKDREERLHQEEVVVEEEKPKTKKQLAAEERRLKEEREREEKEREKEKEKEEPPKKPMKFPAEDLLVKYNPEKDGPEGRILARPALKKDLPFGDDFERFLMSWSFLNVMGKPLGLSPFSLDDFEQALYHNDPWTSPTPLMMEINAVLLNCLITDFNTTNEAVRPLSLTGSTEENDTDYWEGKKGATAETLRPAATDLVQRWKGDTLKADNKRKSWEDALVGCLWERATLATFPSYLDIILHLTFEDKPAPTRPTWSTGPPNSTSALGLIPAKPEKRYSSLHHLQKLQIIVFLTELASQTAVVRDFMDESVNALTEVRKEQVEVKREWKRLVAERDALDPKKNKALEGDVDGDGDVSMDGPAKDERATSPDASLNGLPHGISTGDHDELDSSIAPLDDTDSLSDVESHDPGANGAAEAHRETAASRRRAMQEKAAEREAEEAIRTAKATAEKAKRREGQQLTAERKKISDEIAVLSHKLRSLEYDFRSHIYTLRNRPMGYDRFGNAVWWFDGLGSAPLFNENGKAQLGTGRLYLQGSDANEVEQLCGPAEVSEQEVKQRKKAEEGETKLSSGEWAMYDDPEQLHQFLTWLNPRGIRELALLKQLNHWIPELEAGMRKRRLVAGVDADPAGDEPAVKRSRPVRRAVGAGGANGDEGGGGYMAWRNRRA